jgi:hypothetical protein
MNDCRRRALALVVVGALAAGCARQVTESPEDRQRADFPEQEYRQAAKEGRPVFRVDPALSLAVLEVRRAGSLARLGHDHVIASHDLRGYLLPDAGRADLYVALERLAVDEPGLRADAGFATQLPAEAIDGTRRNMLDKVLDVERYPLARIHVTAANATSAVGVVAAITLHGVTRSMPVAVQIERLGDDMLIAGRLTLKQTDFGIEPLSILGGAIQVQDQVDLRFRIRANRTAEN